jgi:hypothetical protein
MTSSDPGVSPLRRRMVDDLRMRKFAPKTQTAYLRAVRQFARFLGRASLRLTESHSVLRVAGIEKRRRRPECAVIRPLNRQSAIS